MDVKHDYPGRLTAQQWQALPLAKRRALARRAQCDLLGSFRHCRNKRCRRARTCCADPLACVTRLWSRKSKKSKRLRREYARLGMLADVPRGR